MGRRGGAASLDATGLRIAIVASRYNEDVVGALLEGAAAALKEHGVDAGGVLISWVPGSFEIPLAALALAESGRFDAIVALGCVIRGETAHFEHVAGACAQGLVEVCLKTGIPCAFGVLTTYTREQAERRARDSPQGEGNKGREAAEAAIEMARLLPALRARS
ncbi:MAG: 6,7-dimethyl-8-ribityllumazine synthase [Candidatus Dormibacterales bacterium]